jgi:arsenate reductase (thioredoxin)
VLQDKEATMGEPIRVLFLCTGNSVRSQMAEALLRHFGGADFAAFSAGTEPVGVHPLTVEVMRDAGLDISNQRSKAVSEFRNQDFDFIVSLCEAAHEQCVGFSANTECIHWAYPDPLLVEGTPAEQKRAFSKVYMELRERIHLWVLNQRKLLRERVAAQS